MYHMRLVKVFVHITGGFCCIGFCDVIF